MVTAPNHGMSRRDLSLIAMVAAAAVSGVGIGGSSAAEISHLVKGPTDADTVTVADGTKLYFKDWGSGQPVVFSHGWPLSSDAFEDQMFFLASQGYRCIAHDRRGHGRSSQPWDGNDMDTYADDLAALVQALDVRDAIHIGHSTGAGEVARYIGRHGTARVAKAVLISSISPTVLETKDNPGGIPIQKFDGIRSAILADRSNSALRTVGLVRHSTLKVYEGAPHGLCTTMKDRVNADLLAFIRLRAE